jgi:hypothetical protein
MKINDLPASDLSSFHTQSNSKDQTWRPAPRCIRRLITMDVFVDERTLLPSKLGVKEREFLKGEKFIFEGAVSGHDLLGQYCFPKGWKKCRTSVAANCWLLDDEGERRGVIVYIPSVQASLHIY